LSRFTVRSNCSRKNALQILRSAGHKGAPRLRAGDLEAAIERSDVMLAQKCFHIALESLVHTKEFGLARSFMPDPRKEIDQFAIPFKFARQHTGSVSQEML